MSHIFISYSRSELDIARYIRASLEAEGFAVWMDEQALSAGMDWWDTIEANIDACGAFVALMSPDASNSVYVKNEILRALDQKKALFPVLLSGKPFSLLAHAQFEDMRGGLTDKLSPEFIKNLRQIFGDAPAREVRFEIVGADALEYACDTLIMKTASGSTGLEFQVAIRLEATGTPIKLNDIKTVGDYMLIDSAGAIAAKQSLFIRTVSIYQFDYRHTREFGEQALRILAKESPETKHVALTVHGVNTVRQLDEGESLLAMIAGLIDAIKAGTVPRDLERITIIERDSRRINRLQKTANPFLEEVDYATRVKAEAWAYDLRFGKEKMVDSPDAGLEIVKPYALVLLPQDPDLEDIYYYGIQRPVHAMGLLCERAVSTTEDNAENMEAVLSRINQARAFVCDVSEISPKLYLQLGYAMGKGIPVALIGRKENPDFAEAIAYQKIWELEERLGQWLKAQF